MATYWKVGKEEEGKMEGFSYNSVGTANVFILLVD